LRKLEPPLSVVRVDDVITWINTAPVPHTATSRTGEFDSGAIDRASLGSAQQRARAPFHTGTFPYLCVFHPTMTGLLRVN